jgi:uncharacterized protein (DUF58 family)
MTARFAAAASVLLVSGLCALSLGGRVFYLIMYALLGMLLYALGSAFLARALLVVDQRAAEPKSERGSPGRLDLRLTNRSLLPVAPFEVALVLPTGQERMRLDAPPLREAVASVPFVLNHVGVLQVFVRAVYVTDLFGFFRFRRTIRQQPPEVVVLPRPFDVTALKFLAQDDGKALPNRSSEDITSPEDTRAYREGDSFKRVHWKLSARKRELLVRRFEMPAPPDTLILMDCTDPRGGEGVPDGLMRLRDTLCETALSVAKMQMEGSHPVRVPLYGAHASEFHADRAGSLSVLQEELAYQIFRGGEPFDRVLNVELRRMRRTGAAVVITTRLDARVVEGVKHIRRSGPSVRFYLVTFHAEDEALAPLIAQLQHHLVEVCYVTPA